MTPHRYKLFSQNVDIVKAAIEYFLCEVIDKEKFEQIKQLAIQQNHDSNGNEFIGLGYLSVIDFSAYIGATNPNPRGFNLSIIEEVVKALTEEKILNTLPSRLKGELRYKAAGEFADFFYKRDLILNTISGWNFIIDKFNNSVIKIEHKDKKGDYSIGTGFYYAAGDENIEKYLIVTNRHVLENAAEIKAFLHDGSVITFDEIVLDKKRDLGFLVLDKPLPVPIIHLSETIEVLSEILTIGYPSIPMTKHAYQVYHKGEVNSFVEDYWGNKLFLISAKTSSGNSGSPILDRHGLMIGIITEELFEKEQFYTKGKLPYYAGIPTEEIRKSMNENIFNS